MNVFRDDENKKPIPYDRLSEGQRGFVKKVASRVPERLREELMELLVYSLTSVRGKLVFYLLILCALMTWLRS